MTIRQRLHAKPIAVQIVLKAHMTKASLDDESPNWDAYALQALQWWEGLVIAAASEGMSETELAERAVNGLRSQDVWGSVLREGTQ